MIWSYQHHSMITAFITRINQIGTEPPSHRPPLQPAFYEALLRRETMRGVPSYNLHVINWHKNKHYTKVNSNFSPFINTKHGDLAWWYTDKWCNLSNTRITCNILWTVNVDVVTLESSNAPMYLCAHVLIAPSQIFACIDLYLSHRLTYVDLGIYV